MNQELENKILNVWIAEYLDDKHKTVEQLTMDDLKELSRTFLRAVIFENKLFLDVDDMFTWKFGCLLDKAVKANDSDRADATEMYEKFMIFASRYFNMQYDNGCLKHNSQISTPNSQQ
ncbi:MAG: hypothetical protein IIT61_03290 [Bacteroidales bacterium]|nr:hypothetical protein [Bacteroidales bacterium]MBQ2002642.1 hypothetical protein [Bacteroidaceae bacterium]MBQ2351519.1 hypothetical protein [Bacteroidales bacterium]MBQ2573974.1 hypothetical protein [Bacteroidales bacterium]MBQ5423931.1 hypothetical protein [Bacteroidales bacterium]